MSVKFDTFFINYDNNTMVKTALKDQNDQVVALEDVIKSLTSYIKEKVDSKETNTFKDQILPLMTQAVILALPDLIGTEETALLTARPHAKFGLIYAMGTAFLLLKYMQKHNISIETTEEEMNKEDIDRLIKRISINNAVILGIEEGMSKEEILTELLSLGKITEEDINDFNEYYYKE